VKGKIASAILGAAANPEAEHSRTSPFIDRNNLMHAKVAQVLPLCSIAPMSFSHERLLIVITDSVRFGRVLLFVGKSLIAACVWLASLHDSLQRGDG
jgi:hypothetical protein